MLRFEQKVPTYQQLNKKNSRTDVTNAAIRDKPQNSKQGSHSKDRIIFYNYETKSQEFRIPCNNTAGSLQ